MVDHGRMESLEERQRVVRQHGCPEMTRLLAKLLALAIITLCSCTEAPSDIASVRLGGANDGATSGPVIADNRLIPGEQRPISLELSVQSGNRLLLSVVNDTDKSLFAERNLLVHSISGVPMLFPFVRTTSGQLLFLCGHFEDPAEAYESVEILPGEKASFDISIDEIKSRYCVDQASVSVQAVEPMGGDFRSFAGSNEIVID